ncbi:Uroporphyrinogen III decarboxylase (EC 4.1.1.37) [uncultured Gammaproteobacteria bacterium]|jgi:uroporphyrinogen decarboxylase|uniref:Uroporphyrinogen decarboxylase n=3 Tax=sulfur-oxidizing symbionts TaxID=32036 RepID=A0A1H6K496_9GAMM|nr:MULTISPECIES: uroporphyrinogen decarboxylase [Gammaproteobacteria]CAC9495248.1 Uroporphyrinogen III decarboxylase (EC 4.1.1.37) [uncultured Gammaproteobacteria bacterium]CAB5501435.1 Uroporphyrinogen III decarboxylase (EC [Bathymodiolus thermophilus thioautotrophic gill symbiont]CAB5501505.1 Uroporphyrinogen III decarboxylase (EC [Bathymodiolus azoricus thioautotrophic gill symbiont]CAC9499257.1 Uroporphyrinogen III decarboxylase (EC 4.1.1.37) [uncultured Gammaproteobacteria bacterium]CAC95
MSFDYINALLKKPTTRTPIWVMRQAGRYLPEYRATRKQAGDFLSLCKNPELACEVTLQPIDRFDLDAAILFSDILTIPDAMGLGLYFSEGEGPKFKNPIQNLQDIEKLPSEINNDLTYVFDGVSTIKKALNNRVPLIGFSGSPWTLATYMIEGGSSKTFANTKKMLFNEPKALHLLLDKLAHSVIAYLNQQILSGADSVMIFDTWGGVLSKQNYLDFSLDYMAKIVKGIKAKHPNIPITLFSKNGGKYLTYIADTLCDGIGIDWTVELSQAQQEVGNKVAIQGNLDPAVLYATPEIIEREVKKVLSQFKGDTGHIFNLGHGITPDVDPENMKVLVDSVHNLSKR